VRGTASARRPETPSHRLPTSDSVVWHRTSALAGSALANIYSILQSAAATAYEHADNQTGSNRKVAMGVVHLIELAQLRMDSVLDGQPLCVNV